MACKYFVPTEAVPSGEWIDEIDFKKILNDGLLDQLIVNKKFSIPDFKINQELVDQVAPAIISKGPIKLRISHKTNKR